MSNCLWLSAFITFQVVEPPSADPNFFIFLQLEAEFRRFNVKRDSITGFEEFFELVQCIHRLYAVPFDIFYRDPLHGDLLPINNTENCIHALNTAQPLLRLFLQRKGKIIHVKLYIDDKVLASNLSMSSDELSVFMTTLSNLFQVLISSLVC